VTRKRVRRVAWAIILGVSLSVTILVAASLLPSSELGPPLIASPWSWVVALGSGFGVAMVGLLLTSLSTVGYDDHASAMELSVCPECGGAVGATWRLCPHCGAVLSSSQPGLSRRAVS
jgi:ribosomal protein L32